MGTVWNTLNLFFTKKNLQQPKVMVYRGSVSLSTQKKKAGMPCPAVFKYFMKVNSHEAVRPGR
jgi:hypothetical protein